VETSGKIRPGEDHMKRMKFTEGQDRDDPERGGIRDTG